MANQSPGTGLLVLGLAAGAVGLGWWLIGRGKAGAPTRITIDQARAFALAWSQIYEDSTGLILDHATRGIRFTGKPPIMSDADWAAVGGTPTSEFYYMEFLYTDGSYLTVMIDAFTGEKPPVSQGWVAGPIANNFGL